MDPQQQQQQQQANNNSCQPKTREFVKSLSDFFKRDLISIPLIKKCPHQQVTQRCGLKASTLELDTTAYPNIEYIAGNRLSIYPVNPHDHVQAIMKHVQDDIGNIGTIQQQQQQQPAFKRTIKLNEPWAQFALYNGRDTLRLALTYLYDITTAPSKDLLRLMADCCTSRDQKSKLIAISKSDESWEKWICLSLRSLKSTFDEFNTCFISAKRLFSELHPQQPRQYSISSIKSSKRSVAEIIVFQHKFNNNQIAISLQDAKEHDKIQQQDVASSYQVKNRNIHANQVDIDSSKQLQQQQLASLRSLRSATTFSTTPISSQQVTHVPSFSGPLMSLYALTSSTALAGIKSATSAASIRGTSSKQQQTLLASKQQLAIGKSALASYAAAPQANADSIGKQYDGLCSNYLLNLNEGDYIICEFVENPRFTLKGNRERPIMMIGQDVGVIAFRSFWQQRALEHDRAQVFYTLFKDLKPKKFGDMQLVCLTGNRCKVEDLFKREINLILTHKIISNVNYIGRGRFISLLDYASTNSLISNESPATTLTNDYLTKDKELLDLGSRISRLLIENNGCLYTCCDAKMTQAIEILIVESIARANMLTRVKVMSLLPKWKGRKTTDEQKSISSSEKFLYTLENPYERAQIVQEIYDT